MVKKLKYLLLAIPLFAIASWELDFDDDFASASFGSLPPEWTPLDLGSKLFIWYDMSDASTVIDSVGSISTNGASVQTINDKSGNGRNANSPAVAQRPNYDNVQNGKSGIVSTGVSQLDAILSTNFTRNVSVNYIFGVFLDPSQTSGDGNHLFVSCSTSVSPTAPKLSLGGRITLTSNGWAGQAKRLESESVTNVFAGVVSGVLCVTMFADYANGYGFIYTNGVIASSSPLNSSGASDDKVNNSLRLFRTSGLTECPSGSKIGEIILVNQLLTGGELEQIHAYLISKWGI